MSILSWWTPTAHLCWTNNHPATRHPLSSEYPVGANWRTIDASTRPSRVSHLPSATAPRIVCTLQAPLTTRHHHHHQAWSLSNLKYPLFIHIRCGNNARMGCLFLSPTTSSNPHIVQLTLSHDIRSPYE